MDQRILLQITLAACNFNLMHYNDKPFLHEFQVPTEYVYEPCHLLQRRILCALHRTWCNYVSAQLAVWDIKYSEKHRTLVRLLHISYQIEAIAVKLAPFADV
jgi:hypothetical protein